MNKQRLGLVLTAFLGAMALHFTTWITKTSFAAGESSEKLIGIHESGLGRQAHLILLAIGLVAILAPGAKDGLLTNRLSDSLGRLGRLTVAALGIGLLATCYLSMQVNADNPAALLSSYVMEAEGEIGVAQDDLKAAKSALGAGKAEAEAAVATAQAKVDAMNAAGSAEAGGDAGLAEAQATLSALNSAVSDAELGVEETKAMADEMRAMTPAQMFEGEHYKAAGFGHLLGILFGLSSLLILVCSRSGALHFATEKRWVVASLSLLASAAVLAACQTATVGPMEIGVKALEHPEGKAIQGLGLAVAFGVLVIRRDKSFGWVDGLLFTGLLGAMVGAGMLHTTDIVLQGTQVPASQMLSLVLPVMALVSLWPIGACCNKAAGSDEATEAA
jgi:hypothetical protein